MAGGSGFIGSHIVDALSETPESTVVVYDIQARNNKVGNVVGVRGDVFDLDRLVKVMKEQNVANVIHMVGLASIPGCRKSPDVSFRLNLSSVQKMLEAMRISDAEHLVFSSTAAVYGITNGPKVSEGVKPKPTSIYGSHKRAAELLIRGYAENYGIDTTILRIFNVYGDLKMEQGVVSLFVRRALKQKPIILRGGEQLRDFVYLDDVVESFIRSLENVAACQKVINVGSGVGVSIKEVAGMVEESFPEVGVMVEPPVGGEYSIYADVSRMRTVLNCDVVNPRLGIPIFVEKCKRKNENTEE